MKHYQSQLKPLRQALMERDGITADEAEQLVKEASAELRLRIEENDSMIDLMDSFCYEWFGLEPDYIEELI